MKKNLIPIAIVVLVVVGVIVLMHVADPIGVIRRLHGG